MKLTTYPIYQFSIVGAKIMYAPLCTTFEGYAFGNKRKYINVRTRNLMAHYAALCFCK